MSIETCIFKVHVQNEAARNILTLKQHNPNLNHSVAYLNLQIDLYCWSELGKMRKKYFVCLYSMLGTVEVPYRHV